MDRNKDGYITKVTKAFSGLGPNLLKTKTRIRRIFNLLLQMICFSSQGELKLAKKKLSMKEVDSVSDRAVSRNIIETKAYSCHKTICKAIE